MASNKNISLLQCILLCNMGSIFSSPKAFYISLRLLALTCLLFYENEISKALTEWRFGNIIFFVLLASVSTVLFFTLYNSSPGFCDVADEENGGFLPKDTLRNWLVSPSKDLSVTAYCRSPPVCEHCHCIRTIRSKHCFTCGRCVLRFDHHCDFLNTCVGFHNHGRFLIFCFLEFLTIYHALGHLFGSFVPLRDSGVYDWFYSNWLLLLCIIPCIFVMLVMFGLTGVHFVLALCNRTTYEWVKGRDIDYLVCLPSDVQNPFSKGLYYNLLDFFSPSKHRDVLLGKDIFTLTDGNGISDSPFNKEQTFFQWVWRNEHWSCFDC
eukprot:GCRY01001671.1.p1 GENE.GCRY01001671.1~~GCRY01001671.1.p1  ORF type:complete len:322 (+),score=12.36 GCRY01001671.1:160-1125(+)